MFELVISGIILIEQIEAANGTVTSVRLHVVDASQCQHHPHEAWLTIPASAILNPYQHNAYMKLVPDGKGAQNARLDLLTQGGEWTIQPDVSAGLETTQLAGLPSLKKVEPQALRDKLDTNQIKATITLESGSFELRGFLMKNRALANWEFRKGGKVDGGISRSLPLANLVAVRFPRATSLEILDQAAKRKIDLTRAVTFSVTNDPVDILADADVLHHFGCVYSAFNLTGTDLHLPRKPQGAIYHDLGARSSVSVFCPPPGYP